MIWWYVLTTVNTTLYQHVRLGLLDQLSLIINEFVSGAPEVILRIAHDFAEQGGCGSQSCQTRQWKTMAYNITRALFL